MSHYRMGGNEETSSIVMEIIKIRIHHKRKAMIKPGCEITMFKGWSGYILTYATE